jgi:hypothetical protein
VATRTSSTRSNRIDGGRPGRASLTKPARRLATNRRRRTACTTYRPSQSSRPARRPAARTPPQAPRASRIRARTTNLADDASRDHATS